MSEIIGLHFGQAGIRVGKQFWKKIIEQHELKDAQSLGIGNMCFFQDKQKNRECRNIFIDKQPSIIDEMKQDLTLTKRIKEKNMISGKGNGQISNIYGGYFHQNGGQQLLDQFIDKLRIQVQSADKLSGFLINGSLGGGFFSGFGARVLSKLRQQYCSNIIQNYPIIPDLQQNVVPIQIYNTVFAIHHNVQHVDLVMMLQNHATRQRLFKKNIFLQSNNGDKNLISLNNEIGQLICQSTAPYRFSGNLNVSQRKRATSMVMFPRLKFLCPSFSLNKTNQNNKIKDPLVNCLDFNNYFITNFFVNPSQYWDIYCMSIHSRDVFGYEQEITQKTKSYMESKNIKFAEWIPNSFQVSISNQINGNNSNSHILINSPHIMHTFKQIGQHFTASFRRKAFVHHYTSQGVDEMQFTQAESNLNDLVSQYVPCMGFYEDDDEFYDQQVVQQQQ